MEHPNLVILPEESGQAVCVKGLIMEVSSVYNLINSVRWNLLYDHARVCLMLNHGGFICPFLNTCCAKMNTLTISLTITPNVYY